MRAAAVYCSVRVISDAIAQMPFHMYLKYGSRLENVGRAYRDQRYFVVHDEPNSEMSAFEFKKLMQVWLLLKGNAYAKIERSVIGDPIAIWPIPPDLVEVKRDDADKIIYEVKIKDGTKKTYQSHEILHLKGMSYDGLVGLSPIMVAKESVGAAIGADQMASRMWGNDARPSMIFEADIKIPAEAKKSFVKEWDSEFGSNGRKRTAILDQGLKAKTISISPEEAQFLETRGFSVEEIACRIYGLPPNFAGLTDKQTSWGSGIEQQDIGFVKHTLGPWLSCWESAFNRSLLKPDEKAVFYFEFQRAALVMGDIATRYSAYATGLNNGILNINEVRAKENLNPVEGGDTHRAPLNLAPINQPQPTGGTNEQDSGNQ